MIDSEDCNIVARDNETAAENNVHTERTIRVVVVAYYRKTSYMVRKNGEKKRKEKNNSFLPRAVSGGEEKT